MNLERGLFELIARMHMFIAATDPTPGRPLRSALWAGLGIWLAYGVWTYVAVLPDVPPGGQGRMAVLKLIRTATGFGVGLALVTGLWRLRQSRVRGVPLGVVATAAIVTAGYLWLGLYQGLSAPLRSPTFFPIVWSSLPRAGLDHVFVLVAWGGLALWWMDRRGDSGEAAAEVDVDATPTHPEVPLQPDDHIYLRLDDEMALLRVGDITAILAEGDYTSVWRQSAPAALSDRTMKRWNATLPPRLFARVHRSAIVNLSRVERLEERANGGQLIHLTGGRHVPMSRRYEARLKETLG
ncbi:MAG: LytTR family DNA-binding domain-containing protein [Longimicrobiales bacterium]